MSCDPATYDPALSCLRSNEPLGFDPDGMSGGSAFVVQVVDGEFRAYFAGLVVTGGETGFTSSRLATSTGSLMMIV
jgi:hypothetical protein